jgi:outer membrane murein-binding lipoprotein Lpp
MTHESDRVDALHHEVQNLKAENTRLRHKVDALTIENTALRTEVARTATEVIAIKDNDGRRCRTGMRG